MVNLQSGRIVFILNWSSWETFILLQPSTTVTFTSDTLLILAIFTLYTKISSDSSCRLFYAKSNTLGEIQWVMNQKPELLLALETCLRHKEAIGVVLGWSEPVLVSFGWRKSWKPYVLAWKICCEHYANQTAIHQHHLLTPLQDSHYIWTRSDCQPDSVPYRFEAKSQIWPCLLLTW